MSLNKVLNRPLFRKEALRKGYLKPIRAQLGTMVGPTMDVSTGPQRFPMINVAQPKPLSMTRRFFNTVGRAGRAAFGLPFLLGSGVTYGALDRSDPEGNLPESVKLGLSGLGGAAATRLPGAAALGSMGIGPQAVLFGTGALIQNRIAAGRKELERIEKMSPEERKRFEIEQRNKAFNYFDGGVTDQELFGADADKIKFSSPKTKVTQRPSKAKVGGGRLNVDRLTEPENESKIAKGTVDIDKVIKNNVDEGDLAIDEMKIQVPPPPTKTAKKEEDEKKTETVGATTSNQANKQLVKNQTENVKTGDVKAGDGTEINNEVIDLARAYSKELRAGQTSQAKTVFLANLASGLLTGTTTKSGIAGALEVFGQALGPAVNNYATIKLKEDELSNDFMETALELAQDEIAAKNEAVEIPAPDVKDTGVIRIIQPGGKVQNFTGRELKDGTIQIAILGLKDQFGRQVYQTYTGRGDFLPRDFKNEQTSEILFDLEGKYRALSTTDKSLKILEDAYDQDKELGGLVGKLKITTERVTDALGSLTGISDRVDFGNQYQLLLEKDAQALVNSGEFSDLDSAKKYLKETLGSINDKGQAVTEDGKSYVKEKLNQFLGDDRTSDAQNLERLAVNETILVYALANALKSKDRLTQKDIQNAKELVKVFSLGRGTKTTIRSLRALRETLVDSIGGQERLYRLNGGDKRTLGVFRVNYGLESEKDSTGNLFPNLFDLQQSDLLKQFGDLPK